MPLITGTIRDEAQALYVGPVIFENLDAPCSGGAFVTGPAETSIITESDGSIPADTRLAPGRTRMVINGRKSKTFTIPEGNGTYDLATLMASPAARVTAAQDVLAMAMGNQFVLSDIERDSGEVITTATITWRDGSSGVYTMTLKNEAFNDADAWTMTHEGSGYTVTQPTLTRDESGFVIDEPIPTIS